MATIEITILFRNRDNSQNGYGRNSNRDNSQNNYGRNFNRDNNFNRNNRDGFSDNNGRQNNFRNNGQNGGFSRNGGFNRNGQNGGYNNGGFGRGQRPLDEKRIDKKINDILETEIVEKENQRDYSTNASFKAKDSRFNEQTRQNKSKSRRFNDEEEYDEGKLKNLKQVDKLSNMFGDQEGGMLDYYDLSTERGKKGKRKNQKGTEERNKTKNLLNLLK